MLFFPALILCNFCKYCYPWNWSHHPYKKVRWRGWIPACMVLQHEYCPMARLPKRTEKVHCSFQLQVKGVWKREVSLRPLWIWTLPSSRSPYKVAIYCPPGSYSVSSNWVSWCSFFHSFGCNFGQGSKKIVCFAHKILVFHFFHFYFLLMVLYDVTFNVTATIWMWSFWFFSRILTRSIVLKFGVKTPVNKNNSNSLILTILELQFEPCMLDLIWKWCAKDLKKWKDHLIFIDFGVKKFTLKNTQKNKTLTFECYNLLDPMEWGALIFGGWCSIR
jgi:hypothetical protein